MQRVKLYEDCITIDIPQNILNFIKKLNDNTAGYDLYLGGGYLRDTYKGLTPKDIDLFFVPNKREDVLRWVVDKKLPSNVMTNYPVYDYTSPTQDMQDRGVSRVMCFMESGLSPMEVNFIEYDHYLTGDALAADMDFGINQIMYDVANDKLIYTDNFVLHHHMGVLLCVNQFSKERMWKRYQRMKAKFPDYTAVGEPEACVLQQILWSTPSYSPSNGGSFVG